LKKTPDDGNGRNKVSDGAFGHPPQPLLFFGHTPGQVQTVILFRHFIPGPIFRHNIT
jgi:hypothetical protein